MWHTKIIACAIRASAELSLFEFWPDEREIRVWLRYTVPRFGPLRAQAVHLTLHPIAVTHKEKPMELAVVVAVTLLFPPILLFGFFIVNPREEMVVLRFGKYVGTVQNEGIRWIHPVGRSLKRIPTQDMTLHVNTSTVVERNGNPILISAVVVYRVEDTKKAALDVENYRKFIEDQAGAVIKRVSSQFPYESPEKTEPCLKSESEEVSRAYLHELQRAVDPAGIRVLGVRLNDLTYAPEIAQAMLMRQQAQAMIDARKMIVEGAVSIVHDALGRLHGCNVEISTPQREVLISNLLVVLCSGEHPQPVLQVQAAAKM